MLSHHCTHMCHAVMQPSSRARVAHAHPCMPHACPYACPSHASSYPCRSLLDALLSLDPAARPGGRGPASLAALKAHPWFAANGIQWDALLEHKLMPPTGIRERIYNFEGVLYAHFDPKPYDGDMAWANNF